MLSNTLALGALVLGLLAANYAPGAVRRRWGGHALGRFAADWAGALCYALGVGALLVLWNGGRSRYRGGWQRWDWPSALAIGVALATLWAVVEAVRRERHGATGAATPPPRPSEFPPNYVRELLDAERRAPAEDCRKMARALEKRSRKAGEPLPPELRAFVERHRLPEA